MYWNILKQHLSFHTDPRVRISSSRTNKRLCLTWVRAFPKCSIWEWFRAVQKTASSSVEQFLWGNANNAHHSVCLRFRRKCSLTWCPHIHVWHFSNYCFSQSHIVASLLVVVEGSAGDDTVKGTSSYRLFSIALAQKSSVQLACSWSREIV